jgi:hypothetical protein
MRTETICIHLPAVSNTINTGGHVNPQRYPKLNSAAAILLNTLIVLVIFNLVPVVGLEPTRLFKAPGF